MLYYISHVTNGILWNFLRNFCVYTYFVVVFFLSHFSATIQAISAYLDAFQKIADAATNSRGNLYTNSYVVGFFLFSSKFILRRCIKCYVTFDFSSIFAIVWLCHFSFRIWILVLFLVRFLGQSITIVLSHPLTVCAFSVIGPRGISIYFRCDRIVCDRKTLVWIKRINSRNSFFWWDNRIKHTDTQQNRPSTGTTNEIEKRKNDRTTQRPNKQIQQVKRSQ